MTSTPCRSAALDCIIAPWLAKIATFLGAIVETILTIAENICNTLQELGVCCRKAGRRLPALRPGLSRPMMSKLGFLPPSASTLHALARKRSPESGQAVMMDWRGKGEAPDQGAVRRALNSAEPSRRLMTILVPPEINDDIGSERRTCPHVKSARRFRRFVNPLSTTEH